MPLVIECPACSRRLRVPDDLIGTRVKCPTCGGIFEAGKSPPRAVSPPAVSDAPPATVPPQPAYTRAPGEVEIKLSLDDDPPPPPPRASERPPPVDEPSRPSRPRPDQRDVHVCPSCRKEIDPRAERCPSCGEEFDVEDDDRPWERPNRYGTRRDSEPHRGTMVLVLGILSIVSGVLFFLMFCWIAGLPLGIAAWVVGHRDLKKMKANVMDPEGYGSTQAGWICGIIGTILNSLVSLFCLGYFGLIAFAAFQVRNMPPPAPPRPTPGQSPPRKLERIGAPLCLPDYLPAHR